MLVLRIEQGEIGVLLVQVLDRTFVGKPRVAQFVAIVVDRVRDLLLLSIRTDQTELQLLCRRLVLRSPSILIAASTRFFAAWSSTPAILLAASIAFASVDC